MTCKACMKPKPLDLISDDDTENCLCIECADKLFLDDCRALGLDVKRVEPPKQKGDKK